MGANFTQVDYLMIFLELLGVKSAIDFDSYSFNEKYDWEIIDE
jgi:hypothetical protein